MANKLTGFINQLNVRDSLSRQPLTFLSYSKNAYIQNLSLENVFNFPTIFSITKMERQLYARFS